MAILYKNNIQINPIDLPQNDKVAIGVTLPFDGYGVFNSSYTTKEQVKSNLINLLLTDPGERLFNPTFGIGIRSLLFEQKIDRETLHIRISDGAARYIPEIQITDVRIERVSMETTPEIHQLQISITYKVLADRSTDSILLNFI